jgi:hypothetical protein
MTHRVEQPREEAINQGITRGTAAAEAARPTSSVNGQPPDSALWHTLLGQAPARQKADWLRAAGADGVVYVHQVADQIDPAAAAPLLAELLAGRTEALTPLRPSAPDDFTSFDPELDEAQRDAVARALASPDLFLIQGLPGTGKSRVLAELLAQAAARGLRTLLLAPAPAATDRALAQVAGRSDVLAVRCAEPGEDAETLPPALAGLTVAAQAARLAQRARERAQQELEAASRRYHDAEHDLRTLAALRTAAVEWQAQADRRDDLARRRQQIAAQVEQEARERTGTAAWLKALAAEEERHRTALGDLEGRRPPAEALCRERERAYTEWDQRVRQQAVVVDAKQRRRIFSLVWWRALFQGRAAERLAEFQCRRDEAKQAWEEAQAKLRDLEAQRELERQRHTAACEQIMATEIAHRQAELEHELGDVTRRQEASLEAWGRQRARLRSGHHLPELPSAETIDRLEPAAAAELTQARQEYEFARGWVSSLTELLPTLPTRLPAAVNLVAGTPAALAQDPHFGDGSGVVFDLLVLDQADQWTETELLAVAGRARRWVLIGHPALDPHSELACAPFHRLWSALHCDPALRSCPWVQRGEQLVCQLHPVAPEQQPWLQCEPVVDEPDVELRILHAPNARPILAEVAFAAARFPIERAKAYLYQQLEELALGAEARALRWRQSGDRLVLLMGGDRPAPVQEIPVALEEGVVEVVEPVAPTGNGERHAPLRWTTARLEFDLIRGWSRTRAEEWLRERTGWHDWGRTAVLEVVWRAQPALAAFWTEVLAAGPAPVVRRPSANRPVLANVPPVQWVAVAAAAASARPRAGKPARSAAGQHSLGLEVDLSDPRQRQRLPLEVQLRLPKRGIVNLAEAEAVIRALEALIRLSEPVAPADAGRPAPLEVAVLSWQPAQVHLLEALWEKAQPPTTLAQVRFATPARFREHEADVVLLSLCKSPGAQAVPYADEPDDWRVVLAGARAHLLLFGDPSALGRRGQHNGPLGRQTGAAAAWERAVVVRLSKYLDTHDCRPRLPALEERVPQ